MTPSRVSKTGSHVMWSETADGYGEITVPGLGDRQGHTSNFVSPQIDVLEDLLARRVRLIGMPRRVHFVLCLFVTTLKCSHHGTLGPTEGSLESSQSTSYHSMGCLLRNMLVFDRAQVAWPGLLVPSVPVNSWGFVKYLSL